MKELAKALAIYKPAEKMACPKCGRLVKPYESIGKYSCEDWAGEGAGCGRTWRRNPETGEVEDESEVSVTDQAFEQIVQGWRTDDPFVDYLLNDVDDIEKTLSAFMRRPGMGYEIRVLAGDGGTFTGVFDNVADAAAAAREWNEIGNVYVLPSPTNKPLSEMHQAGRGDASSDTDVVSSDWFVIDFDGQEEPGSQEALELLEYLGSLDWPDPMIGWSGNGHWFNWKTDLPNTPEITELRSRVLYALKARFPNVDVSVKNPARIVRVFGTLNLGKKRRGVEYPPAQSYLIEDVGEVLTKEQLEMVAPDIEPPPTGAPPTSRPVSVDERVTPVLEALEKQLGITVKWTDRYQATVKRTWADVYRLSDCPFYPEEDHGAAAALYVWDDGGFSFRCLGGRCSYPTLKTLDDLGELLELETKTIAVPGTRDERGRPTLRTILAAELEPELLDFAWDNRIVLRNLNLIMGNEQAGKGVLIVALTKEITEGRMTGIPERVAIASTEENPRNVIVPRLMVAGVDMSMVRVFGEQIELPEALEALQNTIEDEGFSWLFLDPVNAHMSGGFDPDRKNDVRFVLQGLVDMTKVVPVTVVGAIHTNRVKSVEIRDIQAHSQEYMRIARSTVLLGQTKDDDDDLVIAHVKHNYSRPAASQKAYIHSVDLEWAGKTQSYPLMELDGLSNATPQELIAYRVDVMGRAKEVERQRTKREAIAGEIRRIWEGLGKPATVEAWQFYNPLAAMGYDHPQQIKRGRELLKEQGIVIDTDTGGSKEGSVGGATWRFK